MTTYYTVTGNPINLSRGASPLIRAEYTLIQTAFATVNTEMTGKGAITGQAWTGTHTFPTQTQGDNSTKAATTAYADTIKAYGTTTWGAIAGQTWTGTHDFTGATTTVATQAATDATAKAASTAMVQAALTAYAGTNLGLPTYTIADALKSVRLNSGATGYEWAYPAAGALKSATTIVDVSAATAPTSGQLLTATSSTTATWQTVPSANVQTLTATGTLADGTLVALRTDGTVEPVTQTNAVSATGSAATAHSANDTYVSACYDSTNQRVVVCYKSASDTYGYAVVGTVSGTSISFGTPVAFTSAAITETACVFDAISGTVVIAYYRGAGRAIVGTVSGTSISFGAEASTNISTMVSTPNVSLCYNATAGKVVIGYRGTSNYPVANVGTVSGTTISFGTVSSALVSAASTYTAVASLPSSATIVYGYRDTVGTLVMAAIGTISGTTITFGTPVSTGQDGEYLRAISEPNGVLFFWIRNSNAYYYSHVTASATVAVPTNAVGVPGITGGSALVNYPAAIYDSTASKVLLVYRAVTTSYPSYITYALSGSELVVSDALTSIESAAWAESFVANDSTNAKGVLVHTTSSILKARVQTIGYTSTNADRYIGISKTAVTNGSASIATLGAVVTNQSGLTTGSLYYVTDAGALSTTANARMAGRALSATSLVLEQSTISGPGAWVLLSTVTAAGSATVDIETTFSDAFDEYVILASSITASAAGAVNARLKVSGAYATSGYSRSTKGGAASAVSEILLITAGTSTGDIGDVQIRLASPSVSKRQMISFIYGIQSGSVAEPGYGSGVYLTSGVLTGVRIYPASGVILSGTFRLYGIKK